MDEAASGNHDDADIDITSLALAWICLGMTSAVLGLGRVDGYLDVPWVTVSVPVCLPLSMAIAYGTVLALRDLAAARRRRSA